MSGGEPYLSLWKKVRKQMDLTAKKVLEINLTDQVAESKTFGELNKYIGGVGLGLKLMETYYDKNPIIFSVGPLNGFFPYASKTSIVLNNDSVIEDIYIGGNLSLRMKYAGLDAIVIYGKAPEGVVLNIQNTNVSFKDVATQVASLGLPGKRSDLILEGADVDISVNPGARMKVILNDYFTTPENYLEQRFVACGIRGIVITGTELTTPKDFDKYQKMYKSILARKEDVSVLEASYPSCANCPMGCGKSKVGEIGGNILIHSLVACQYADKIYSDIGIVFSCLNVLGYDYTHEDLELLPGLIEDTLRRLS